MFYNLNPFSAHYKVELFDVRTGGFTPPTPGIGMNVEVKDPDMKIILSRVSIVFTFRKKFCVIILKLLLCSGLQL